MKQKKEVIKANKSLQSIKRFSLIVFLLVFLVGVLLFVFKDNIIKISNNIKKQFNAAEEAIVLEANYNQELNRVNLTWDIENSENYLYKCYQRKGNDSSFQTVSTTTFNEDEYIKVLNVYPDRGNNLATWMNNYGMNIIKVDSVTLSNFNSNPNGYLKDENEEWKYDSLVFGFWDSNNYQDLNATSSSVVEQFIIDGKGVIFGHDTLSMVSGSGLYHPNFASLSKYVNIVNRGSWTNNSSTDVYLTKKGVFTSYPWNIGEVGTHLTIPTAHTLDQTANGDIWIKFNNNVMAGNDNFYLTTWNNCAMIQTGHSNGSATVDEQKILANLIFYTNQLTSTTEMNDYTAIDVNPPNEIQGLSQSRVDEDTITVSFERPEDVGTSYEFYIYGTPKLSNLTDVQSNTVSVNVLSGFAGYSYVVDSNPTCNNLDATIETTDNEIVINKNGYDWTKPVYLHLLAVDAAENKTGVVTLELTPDDPLIYNYNYKGSTLIKAISSKPMKKITYPDIEDNRNITVNLGGKNMIAIDYNPPEEKQIEVTLELEDGTIKNKILTIPPIE